MATIRRAVPDDAVALASLAERTFRDAFSSENDPVDMELHCSKNFGSEIQLREIQNPDMITLLGEENGELIAFAQVRLHSAIECVTAKRPSELRRLYVSSGWHGRGVAHELMKKVLATVSRVASDRIWLGVWERNGRALAFYRKVGFDVVGDQVFELGSDSQRDLVMAMEVRQQRGQGRSPGRDT
jgi:ribosomal protein S18 acetylase RimI-like enzyme